MAESDSGERSEEPTAKKLSDARNKGQIARSKELGTMFVLVGAAAAMMLIGGYLFESLSTIMKRSFSLSRTEVMDVNALFAVVSSSFNDLLMPLMWLFFIIALAAFIGNVLLGGMNFSWEAMAPKASKLSPIAGFKRMFGAKALVEFLKSLLKFFVVVIVSFILLFTFFEQIVGLSTENVPINFSHAVDLLLWMFFALTFSLIIIAVVDVPYQLWDHKNQLKMTKQDIKDEMKNAEGSPEIKGRIRRTQYEMSQRRMMAEVPESDVVITNPTHFSVAIKYSADSGRAPILVAKGIDQMALHIRTIAKEHDVEIIQSPTLARSIYYTTEYNEEIPEELFAAVAQVLAFVFQLDMHKKGKGKTPIPLAKNLPIPEEFRY